MGIRRTEAHALAPMAIVLVIVEAPAGRNRAKGLAAIAAPAKAVTVRPRVHSAKA